MRTLDEHGVDVRFDEGVTTADSCRLSVNMFRPSGSEPAATVIVWTPLGNGRATALGPSPVPSLGSPRHCRRLAAAAGVTVVSVDVRGRGDSDGEFVPFVHERADAAAVVAALAGHSWCAGPIVVMGQGYGAACALAAARDATGLVAGAFLISPPGEPGDVFPGRDGARRADLLVWRHLMAGRHPLPTRFADWAELLRGPWKEQEHGLGHDDLGWAGFDAAGLVGTGPLLVPVTILTGWWDPACRPSWELARACPDAELVVGPWTAYAARHPAQHVGGVDWGPRSVLDPLELQVGLLDRVGGSARHNQVFITGDNAWHELPRTPQTVDWVLRPSASRDARTVAGGGYLGDTADTGVAEFTSDLTDPVPAQPGIGPAVNADAPAQLDLVFLDGRSDLVVYTSAPLAESRLVVGELTLELDAESDSPAEALWVASVEDVPPGGASSLHLTLGVAAVSPGERTAVLRLGPIGHRFLPGHQVRLRLAATCAPLFRPVDQAPAREQRRVHHAGTVLRIPEVV
ncbi:alpha/beta fold hydrolase [Amycolatopsis sp. GM8]|uniref:alpha/beta fold hydrolase n=1 Tax=Amycolatopsis sp. GM8 TaxID=2896530 RepID=UPI001F3D4700|nr:CocE/NonD family hydrolase [Amycolatopsis sp. GM8]